MWENNNHYNNVLKIQIGITTYFFFLYMYVYKDKYKKNKYACIQIRQSLDIKEHKFANHK